MKSFFSCFFWLCTCLMRRDAHPRHSLKHLFVLWLMASAGAAAAYTGSYATSGNGNYKPYLWWLNFAEYTPAKASKTLTFNLPDGSTLTTSVSTSSSSFRVVSEPAWSRGGAFGHGAYDGIQGSPIFYWLNANGTGTVYLKNVATSGSGGFSPKFQLYAADGENTNSSETITYTTSPNKWSLLESVFGSRSSGVPVLTGTGTGTVTEAAPSKKTDGYNNASVILGTSTPTSVQIDMIGNDAVLFAIGTTPVKWTINVSGRVNAADQFTAQVGYSGASTAFATNSTSGTAVSTTTAATALTGNTLTLSVAMAAGSVSSLSSYGSSISCTNSGNSGSSTALPTGSDTSASVTPVLGDSLDCTLTLTPLRSVAGTVYADADHNGSLDAGESGTGLSGWYVKLAPLSAGSCQSPATAYGVVNAYTGAYSLANVTSGSYCLILDNNATLTDIAASVPAGWLGTQNASGVIQITVTNSPPAPQNFGLYHGSTVSGTVFGDTGTGGGTAANGVKDGGESGLAGISVGAGSTGGTVSTGGDGSYRLWIPYSATGTVVITPTTPTGYQPTAGSAGTTGGSYAGGSVSFTTAWGQNYAGVNFGFAPGNALSPNGAQTAQPGSTVTYAHVFTAGTSGQVTFSVSGSASPTSPAWSQVLYTDSTCNGVLDSSDSPLTAPVAVTAGQTVCLLVKQFVPAGSLSGAQNVVTVSATQGTGSLTVTDVTTVGVPSALALSKQVGNVTQNGTPGTSVNAKPGETLQYTLTATNNGSQALSNLVINDATPAFTTFVSAACPAAAALPAGVTSCTMGTQPAVGGTGSLQWTFGGSLAPTAQLGVTYRVQVNGP